MNQQPDNQFTQTILQRNIEILAAVLNGADHDSLQKKYHFSSRASIGQSIREGLQMLSRYSGKSFPDTSRYEILSSLKTEILQAIQTTRLPRVPIPFRLHLYLSKHFGDDYPSHAKQIAAKWDTKIDLELNRWNAKAERHAIARWLASEGYYVDNYIDDAHLAIVQKALAKILADGHDNQVSFDYDHATHYRHGVINFTIKTDKMQATRQLKLSLMDP